MGSLTHITRFQLSLDICKSHMHDLRLWENCDYVLYPQNCRQIVDCFGEAVGRAVEHLQIQGVDDDVLDYLTELVEISRWEER